MKQPWFNISMAVTTDRLIALRNKYVAAVAAKEAELKSLREKLRVIDELDEELELGAPSPSSVNGSSAALKYANGETPLTNAILETVNENGTHGVSASKVAKLLIQNGFKPGGVNFVVTVGTTLRRLEKRGDIRTEKTGGDRLYRPLPVI